jgi:hypothetical protein
VIRRLVAGLIVVGLAVGIWALWPRGDSDTTPTTLPFAVETTTTATTSVPTTTTAAGQMVTSVEEAEEILRELWFGWFEGIYNQDEERIREVVGTQAMLDAARAAFNAPFTSEPSVEGVRLSSSELLRADQECLAVWTTVDVTDFRGQGAISENVVVMRRVDDEWRLATTWTYKEDLWEADCESGLGPVS